VRCDRYVAAGLCEQRIKKKEEEGRGRRGAGRQVGTSNGGKEGMTTLEAED